MMASQAVDLRAVPLQTAVKSYRALEPVKSFRRCGALLIDQACVAVDPVEVMGIAAQPWRLPNRAVVVETEQQ